jgi:ubiquitin carboxyl-terminal hydrolase 9/24
MGSSDTDLPLGGLMNILTNLIMRYPQFKKQVGSVLTEYLIHDCLFEIPHGNKNAPKCKSNSNRKKAFDLILSLTTDCLDNLNVVLSYMKRFNENPSWRTNKESDWSIQLYQDEKSITGHVGIKNLGCICYMNSLHQQLFMIPGFRNDILSVKDPNHDNNSDEDNMFLQWQTLFAGLLLSQKMYVNPKAYCHAFKDWEGQPVNVFEQMDVEEYLTMFMDRLEAAIKGTPQEKTI